MVFVEKKQALHTQTLSDSFIDNIWKKGKELITKETTDIANSVTSSIEPQIKNLCYEGSKVAIKDYSIPITIGIATLSITIFSLGTLCGIWLQNRERKKT